MRAPHNYVSRLNYKSDAEPLGARFYVSSAQIVGRPGCKLKSPFDDERKREKEREKWGGGGAAGTGAAFANTGKGSLAFEDQAPQ